MRARLLLAILAGFVFGVNAEGFNIANRGTQVALLGTAALLCYVILRKPTVALDDIPLANVDSPFAGMPIPSLMLTPELERVLKIRVAALMRSQDDTYEGLSEDECVLLLRYNYGRGTVAAIALWEEVLDFDNVAEAGAL